MATLPTDIPYGTVTGQWVLAVADTPDDADRNPDAQYPDGTVTFTPLVKRVPNTAHPTVYVASKPITATLVEGALSDSTGPGVTLIEGLYDVAFNITDVPIAGFQMFVPRTTAQVPAVDVNDAAPLVPNPTVQFVVNEQVYQDTLAAEGRAQAAADRAEAAADGAGGGGVTVPDGGWPAEDLDDDVQASLGRADSASQPGHLHTAAQITDASPEGRAILTTPEYGAIRDLLDVAWTGQRVTAGTGLTGGGTLDADVTLALSTPTVTSLGKADSASQPGHTHTAAQIADATPGGRVVLTSSDLGLARAAINAADAGVSVSAGTGLTGGGNLTASRTLALSPASVASLAKADAALPGTAATSGQVYANVGGTPSGVAFGTAATASTLAQRNGDGTLTVATPTAAGHAATRGYADGAFAAVGRSITAGTGLTGGGTFAADRTLGLDGPTVASLAKADTATQPSVLAAALTAKADLVGGVIPTSQLPALAINDIFTVASQAAMLALTAQRGDMAIRTDTSSTYVLAVDDPTTLANWKVLPTPSGSAITSVNGQTSGAIVLGKADVGLGNVDNTADSAKPISTATQSALNAKAPLDSPTFTGTVAGVTKAMVGLSAVDNTADSAKPVSTAQQAALDAKLSTSAAGNSSVFMKGSTGVVGGVAFAQGATASALVQRTSTGDVTVNTTPTATTDATSKAYVDTADALLAPKASPTFTGTPAAPTATAGTSTTQLATTAFVGTAVSGKANTASPALTGVPTAPTAAQANNSTQVATTAYVDTGLLGKVNAPTAIKTVSQITAAAYAALATKDASVLYVVVG